MKFKNPTPHHQLKMQIKEYSKHLKELKNVMDEHREQCIEVLREHGHKSNQYTAMIKKQAVMENDYERAKDQLEDYKKAAKTLL